MSVEEKEKKDRKSRHDDNPLRKVLLPNHMAKSSLTKLLAEATHKSLVSLGRKDTEHKESRPARTLNIFRFNLMKIQFRILRPYRRHNPLFLMRLLLSLTNGT